MRVTTAQLYDNLLSGVQKQLDIQAKGNARIASGRRFSTPAEAGVDYKTSLDLRHAGHAVDGSLKAIGIAESRLLASQTTLHNIGNMLKRAQTLAVQQASAQISASERQAASQEVAHLLDQVLNDANQTWQGQSLFAGTAIDQPAFVTDLAGNVVYNGSNQDRIVAVSDRQQIISNVRGDHPAFAAAFQALQNFRNALQTNDVAGVQTALDELNTAHDAMVDLTSEIGARIAAVRFSRASYEDIQATLEKRLNDHEGVDIPAIVTQLQQSSIALQASYSQIAEMRTLSLTNFLR